MEVAQRFERLFQPIPWTGCWIWTGAVFTNGYAAFRYLGKSMNASRASYAIHKGDVPHGMKVLHRCDNPLCVNPDHLWLGTHTDNMHDMIQKGRWRPTKQKGEAHSNAKLSDENVLEIRKLRGDGWKVKALAAKFNVASGTIEDVLYRRWQHLQ